MARLVITAHKPFLSINRGNSSQENESWDLKGENEVPRQQMDSLMSMMHSQISGAISSAISDRVIPEV